MATPSPESDGGTPPLVRDPLLWVSVLATAALCAPFFRYVFWLGDEGILLHGADRMLRGEVLYRDFFEFLPPGGFLLVAAWITSFGADFASVRMLAVGTIAAIAALTYAAARAASGKRLLAAVLAVAWAGFSQGGWTVINHHWLATAASMASAVALLAALRGQTRTVPFFASGLFGGATAMIVSTRGALLCLAIVAIALTLRQRRPLVAAIGGIAVVPTAMLLYLTVTGAMVAAVVDVVLYPARHYSDIQVVAFGAETASHQMPAAVFFPVTLLLAGTTAVVGGTAMWSDARFRASLALAIVGLVGAFPRPDVTHINFTVPLACPLFALVATQLLRRLGRALRIAVSALLVVVCALAIAYRMLGEALPMVAGPLRQVATTRGRFVGPPSPWMEAVSALVPHIERAPRDAAYFFYPYSPMLPYLTGRRHIAPLDVMVPGYTSAAQYDGVCRQVLREAHLVVLDRSWSHPDVLRAIFPGMRDPDPPEKRAHEAALDRGFDRVVHAWRGMELRVRGGAASETLCGDR